MTTYPIAPRGFPNMIKSLTNAPARKDYPMPREGKAQGISPACWPRRPEFGGGQAG